MSNYHFDHKEHHHSLGDKPLIGTSTVLKEVLAKPLTWWASGLAVGRLGWTNSKLKVDGKYVTIPDEKRLPIAEEVLQKLQGLPTKDYLALLDEAYKAHVTTLKEAAEDGTDLHAELEASVKAWIAGEPTPKTTNVKIASFHDWSAANVKRWLFSELHCFSERLWLGGIADAGCELNDGTFALVDFKSAKDAYMDHYLQCALYDIQISENGGFTDGGKKIFDLEKPFTSYIIFPFGAPALKDRPLYDVEGAKKTAESVVQIYKYKQTFL